MAQTGERLKYNGNELLIVATELSFRVSKELATAKAEYSRGDDHAIRTAIRDLSRAVELLQAFQVQG